MIKYTKVRNDFIERTDLSPETRLILIYLYGRMRKDGKPWEVNRDQIATTLGLSQLATRKALASARAKGLISDNGKSVRGEDGRIRRPRSVVVESRRPEIIAVDSQGPARRPEPARVIPIRSPEPDPEPEDDGPPFSPEEQAEFKRQEQQRASQGPLRAAPAELPEWLPGFCDRHNQRASINLETRECDCPEPGEASEAAPGATGPRRLVDRKPGIAHWSGEEAESDLP